jgi:geranylgeranyl reductase family protein
MTSEHEVLIVGAGPAGSALAYFLAARGCDVLLIDKASFPRDKTCGDGLSPRALAVLRTMGLLERCAAAGFRINGIHIFAPDGTRITSPISSWQDRPDFLLVVPRFRLDDLIRAHAVAAGAEFRAHTEATEILRGVDRICGVRANTPDGPRDFRARYTVLATGASVALLERAHLLDSPALFGRAARGYYEGVGALSDHVEFHLESIPLPGYGWVFPISETAANVGAGYFVRNHRHRPRNSPRQVLDEFLANPVVAPRMADARVRGPIKGYPMRFDFPTARVAHPGLLMVGEAAGLVNPLTGEGIDYALESAEVAADVIARSLQAGAAPGQTEREYTRTLRAHFLRPFLTTARVRDFYFHPWMLNRAARAANRYPDFCETIVQVCLGNIDPSQGLSPKVLWQMVVG